MFNIFTYFFRRHGPIIEPEPPLDTRNRRILWPARAILSDGCRLPGPVVTRCLYFDKEEPACVLYDTDRDGSLMRLVSDDAMDWEPPTKEEVVDRRAVLGSIFIQHPVHGQVRRSARIAARASLT